MESPQIPPSESPPIIPSLPPSPPEPQPKKIRRFSTTALIAILLVGLVVGGLVTYTVTYADFNNKLTNLQTQIGYYPSSGTPIQTYVSGDNVSLSNLYAQIKPSVVVIQDLVPQYSIFGGLAGYSLQQGSGFVVKANNDPVIITNNHVIENAINVTVTFSDGTSYTATVLGSDAKADLAVLRASGMPSSVSGLTLVNSATLRVGDPVVAVGSPYGLSGTLTTGVISALGRTITEDDNTRNGQTIADMIQTSTAINSGNSGGPLITYTGDVVGITTAGISNSQGLGFAIPSATIIREINSLITTGSYTQHPSINAVTVDMSLQIAQAMGTSTTNGVDEAIAHINKYGTKHSDSIITVNFDKAMRFLKQVDSAAVYWNASTRFTDGNQFGLGSEIGISNQKLHVRGPMSVQHLTSTKYIVLGDGQIRK